MAFSLATITICGKVGRDPEKKTTAGGKEVTKFSVAIDQGFKENKKTNWFDVVVWGAQAGIVAQYVSKGQQATVTGRFETETYTGKDGATVTKLVVVANDVVSVDLAPRNNTTEDSW